MLVAFSATQGEFEFIRPRSLSTGLFLDIAVDGKSKIFNLDLELISVRMGSYPPFSGLLVICVYLSNYWTKHWFLCIIHCIFGFQQRGFRVCIFFWILLVLTHDIQP